MQPRTRHARATAPFDLSIDSLTHDGRGVGRYKGRAVFVNQAVPARHGHCTGGQAKGIAVGS